MPRFLVALLAAVGLAMLGFAVAITIWDGGTPHGPTLGWAVPVLGALAAVFFAVAGSLTRGRLVPLLVAAAVASVAGGLAAGFMTAGVTASFGLGEATWLATSVLAAGLLPGAVAFSRATLAPPAATA
ncbi:hypothetical protein [Rubrivirga sp. IMCC45206]|uniref:hypothetical protein n=1 Tax=Rubrivirga sp. IMCC45206 TaxID=3391614 RepID=UPI003990335D